MKQMIKNHEAIESLEDFIYFDKASGKIKLKKTIDGVPTEEEVNSKATIWITENDLDAIDDINFTNIKIGDFIYSSTSSSLAIVFNKDTYYCSFRQVAEIYNNVVEYTEFTYEYSEGEWSYYEEEMKRLVGGTKLYKHNISIYFQLNGETTFDNANYDWNIISTDNTPINSQNAMVKILTSSSLIQRFIIDKDELIRRSVAFSGTSSEKQLIIFDGTVAGNINTYAFDAILVDGNDLVEEL